MFFLNRKHWVTVYVSWEAVPIIDHSLRKAIFPGVEMTILFISNISCRCTVIDGKEILKGTSTYASNYLGGNFVNLRILVFLPIESAIVVRKKLHTTLSLFPVLFYADRIEDKLENNLYGSLSCPFYVFHITNLVD